MRFPVGRKENGEYAYLDFRTAANPHMLFNGKSGSGKSFRIRHTMDALHGLGITHHVIEFHPDFEYEFFQRDGAINNITPDAIQHFDFQYATGNAAINPLKMIDVSPDSGGVYSVSMEVVEAVKLWSPSMGTKQASYLNRLLHDVFAARGIHAEEPSTWSLARHSSPDFTDVQSLLKSIINAKRTGLKNSIFLEIESLRKSAMKQAEKVREGSFDNDQLETETNDLEEKKNQLKDSAIEMIDMMVDGKESGNYYSDWDMSTLISLAGIIDDMVTSGLFTRSAIAPKRGKINVYRISKLNPTHQKVMTYLLLKRLYVTSMLTCRDLNPALPNTYIVADEGRYVQEAARHPLSPLNLIFGGSRKFGLGMLVGTQGPHQLSKDMSDNFAIKFVLHSDESAHADAKKNFNLTASQMRALKPKTNAWFFNDGRPSLVYS